LLSFSVCFALAIGEVALRFREYLLNRKSIERAIASPPPLAKDGTASLIHLIQPSPWRRMIYELRPHLALQFAAPGIPTTLVETNDAGFRDRDYPAAKGERTRRILGIGDSLMFGWGIEAGEAYLSLAEERLNREEPEWRWEVINAAVPGYNLAQEVESLERKGLRYSPDLVVVGFFENDGDLPNFIGGESSWASMRRCFVCELVTSQLERESRPLLIKAPTHPKGRTESDPEKVPEAYRDMVGVDGFSRALSRLRELGAAHRFGVVEVVFMRVDERLRPPLIAEIRRQGVPIVNAGAVQARYSRQHGLASYCGTELVVSPTDCHPSALSHRMAAAALTAFVRNYFAADREPSPE
jgi:hypothetical protein